MGARGQSMQPVQLANWWPPSGSASMSGLSLRAQFACGDAMQMIVASYSIPAHSIQFHSIRFDQMPIDIAPRSELMLRPTPVRYLPA